MSVAVEHRPAATGTAERPAARRGQLVALLLLGGFVLLSLARVITGADD